MSRSILGLATPEQRPNLHYAIVDPKSSIKYLPPRNTGWRYSAERMKQLVSEEKILFPKKADGRPREKKFRNDLISQTKPFASIITDIFTAEGTQEIRELFGEEIFSFPKPSRLIRKLAEQVTSEGDLILDYFAGSGTTAQAIFELNKNDRTERKFILVQLPEPTGREDYKTIGDICKERVRRVSSKLGETDNEELLAEGKNKPDRGFRAYKLSSSNFKIWDPDTAPKDEKGLAAQLKLMVHNVLDYRGDDDLLYELILKSGLPLTSKIENLTVAGLPAFGVDDKALMVCLSRPITQEALRGMIALNPQRVLCLDVAFAENDQLKTNVVLEMKSHGIEFRTV
jgi:adenine-specific DNA-methyltransferase